MYCKKCKKNGSLFDQYCKECGTKLEHKKIDSAIYKKFLKIVIMFLIVILVLLIGYEVVNYVRSPQYVARNYFNAISNNDIDKIYEYLDTEDSAFVSRSILTDKMDFFETVNHYEIKSVKQYQHYILVKIQYTTNKETNEVYVKLVKTNDVLQPYKVVSSKIVTDITFKVPSGAKITVDGMELTNPETKNNFDIYTINSMIKGSYQVKIEVNDIIIEEEVEVDNDSNFSISNIDLEEELTTKLTTKTREELNYIYGSILTGKTFDEIKGHFVTETNQLKSSYNSIKRTTNTKITNLEFIDLEIKKATFSSNGKLIITYLADQNITMNEETSLYSKYISVEYDYINNEYEIYNINR